MPLQTVILPQKLENVESSNRDQEKLTPHTWRDKTSQTGFPSSLFCFKRPIISVWYRLLSFKAKRKPLHGVLVQFRSMETTEVISLVSHNPGNAIK